jgi:hypothetical protein
MEIKILNLSVLFLSLETFYAHAPIPSAIIIISATLEPF